MTATHDTIMKANRRGRLRFSRKQRIALLQAYQTSGLSGSRFAALHGVKYPTLANWVQKSKHTAAPRPKMLSFIAAEVLPGPESSNTGPLEVILPGGGMIKAKWLGKNAVIMDYKAESERFFRSGSDPDRRRQQRRHYRDDERDWNSRESARIKGHLGKQMGFELVPITQVP